MADLVSTDHRARLSRVEAGRIIRAGIAAARKPDASALDCPYSAAGDATERVKVAAWMRGFLSVPRR